MKGYAEADIEEGEADIFREQKKNEPLMHIAEGDKIEDVDSMEENPEYDNKEGEVFPLGKNRKNRGQNENDKKNKKNAYQYESKAVQISNAQKRHDTKSDDEEKNKDRQKRDDKAKQFRSTKQHSIKRKIKISSK
eukprot:3451240-Ditylum_brightwellii.AAC.1